MRMRVRTRPTANPVLRMRTRTAVSNKDLSVVSDAVSDTVVTPCVRVRRCQTKMAVVKANGVVTPSSWRNICTGMAVSNNDAVGSGGCDIVL